MRDILFRAKTLETGKWVYGDLVHTEKGLCIQEWMNGSFDMYCIDAATVGQYTELDDVEGAMIFDGDIVVNTRGSNVSIRPHLISIKHGRTTYISDILYCGESRIVKVIGNKYDNPDVKYR